MKSQAYCCDDLTRPRGQGGESNVETYRVRRRTAAKAKACFGSCDGLRRIRSGDRILNFLPVALSHELVHSYTHLEPWLLVIKRRVEWTGYCR